jgi:hypothetical protein
MEIGESSDLLARGPAVQRRLLRRVRILLAFAAAAGLLLGADYVLYPIVATPTAPPRNSGRNGLWLRYTWYFGKHSKAEMEELGSELRERQIRFAYFHVREVGGDGRLQYHHQGPARRLIAAVHGQAPEVKALAWIYAANCGKATPTVDLGDARVRKEMVQEALWLVNECGFDGVQWDYEVCRDGDENFLRLMQDTRRALPAGKVLSAAVPMWRPGSFGPWGWSGAYFARVAATCDQVAVMCYDSGVYWPRAYVGLVRRQAREVTRAVAQGNPKCQALLGLPTYGRGGRSHHARAECLRLGLKGVREGLRDRRASPSAFAGVSLFADYTTDAREWQTYEEWWLGRS